ncbi:MAG TPA: DUF3090 family protein [Candidatus Limnocylindrales bacterium]|jgi:uncharacterized repeat protein (TIGR03847 family)
MTRRIHVFDAPDRFVADAIGQPGQRTFYLQAREGGRRVTVALEKVQVALLAQRLVDLLDAIRDRGIELPSTESGEDDVGPLDEPLDEAFRVGTIAMGWDVGRGRAMIETRAVVEDEDEEPEEIGDDDPDGPDLVRVFLEAPAVYAFTRRAARAVAGGRPPCPVCGEPLDPQGHLCPRRNGYVH